MSAYKDGLSILTVLVDGDQAAIADMVMAANEDPDKPWELDIHRPLRSKEANQYMWVLADKLAKKLRITKEDVYREAIRDIPGVSQIVCVQDDDVDGLSRLWKKRGLGWQVEDFPSKIKGCTNLILYKGSSEYDTAQMSTLIDYLVEECKAQHIETMSPDELARLEGYRDKAI